MKNFFICLLFISTSLFARSLTLYEWIGYFKQKDINITYSSDFISSQTLQKIFFLESEEIKLLGQTIESENLTLVKIDSHNFVITASSQQQRSATAIVIKLVDNNSKQPIMKFSALVEGNRFSTRNGLLLIAPVELKPINFEIQASGYYTLQKQIKPKSQEIVSATYYALSLPVSIDKVRVTASQIDFSNISPGKSILTREDISQNPSAFSDPLGTARQIPGNTSFGISPRSYTRGGLQNESLIILDNHILRKPYHFENFFALFSNINQSVVDEMRFYSGVFPIQYGGRLSSVMDIETSDFVIPDSHEAGLDLLNAHYTFRYNNPTLSRSILLSMRNGGMFINSNSFEHKYTQPEYSDGYFKATQQLNNHWSASQHLLISHDDLQISNNSEDNSQENASSAFNSEDIWLQWNYDNLSDSYATLQFYTTHNHNQRTGYLNDRNSIASLQENINSKYTGLDYRQTINLDNNFSINFGTSLGSETTDIEAAYDIHHFGELVQILNLSRQRTSRFYFNNSGMSAALFINTRYQWSDKIIFDTGLRFDYRQWIKKRLYSPRFNLSYFHDENTVFRIALGRHQQPQYIDELQLEDENPDYLEPSSADLLVLEFDKRISQSLTFRTEAYFKKYSSTQPYYQNLFDTLHIVPELYYDRVRIAPEDSEASGIEFTLSGDFKKYSWDFSYTFSDIFDEINDEHIPRSWDQHSTVKLKFHTLLDFYKIKDWKLDIFAAYSTGWARTELIHTDDHYLIAPRNSSRYDEGLQLDFKLSKDIRLKNGLLSISVNAVNLFNLNSPCCTDYQLTDGLLVSKQKKLAPFIPNIGLVYRWD